MSSSRDDDLRALLPTKFSDYSFDSLGAAETAALEAAFGDGFGDPGAVGFRAMPPPSEVRAGLLQHSYFVSRHSEYDPKEYPDAFWDWDDDRPPPAEFLPLSFVMRRLAC